MKSRGKTWFWGIFFLLAAGFVIANQLGLVTGISIWTLALTVFLAAIFLESALHLEYFGMFMPVAVLGILYDDQLGITAITPWPILIAAFFAMIGCYILFKRKPKWAQYRHENWSGKNCGGSSQSEYTTAPDGKVYTEDSFKESAENITGNEIHCKVSFGESSKYLYSDNLQKAEFSCSFGSLKVFFDQVQLAQEGAIVDLSCSFGSIELYIPRAWTVVDNISSSLGGVSYANANHPEPGQRLTLTGSVSLGGIEIVYV